MTDDLYEWMDDCFDMIPEEYVHVNDLDHTWLTDTLHYDPSTGLFSWKEPGRGRRVDSLAGDFSDQYVRLNLDYNVYYAHRLAFFYMTERWPVEVDHINGNKHDNRWSNLRETTRSMNIKYYHHQQKNNL